MLVLVLGTVSAQTGVRRRTSRKQVETEGKVADTMNKLNERAHSRLTGGMSLSPDQYEDTLRTLFRQDKWEEAKPILISAEREWGGRSTICYLIGRYWYHEGDIGKSRRYLLLALVDDESNTEALELLEKLEEEEGNYATAIVHINDLLSFTPYNIHLWRKKIELYRILGNDPEANKLLNRLAEIYPNDEQVRKDIIYQKEQEYIQLSRQGNEKESQEAIEELILRNPRDPHYYIDLSGSLLKEGKTNEALAICAKGVTNTRGNRTLIRRRVSILQDCARYQEAEQYLDECIRLYGELGLADLRDYLHEQAAYAADAADPYTRHQKIYGATKSEEALDWLISNSMQRGWWDDAQYYLSEKEKLSGKDKQLLVRRYTVEKRLGNDRAASRVLEEMYLIDTTDTDIREMLAEKRLKEGTDWMQEEMWEQALVPLQQADNLTGDSLMHEVLARRIRTCESFILEKNTPKDSLDQLQHSVIYEKEHNLDSAYACLMRYKPSLDEFHEVQRHRYTLQSQLQKNTLSFEYQYVRRSSADEWSHNAYATYTRKWKNHMFEGSAAYAGRESTTWQEQLTDIKDTTYVSFGGTGFQLGAGYYHYFSWGEASIQGSWANHFFPKAVVKLSATENLPMEWTLTERLQWRYIADDTTYHVFSAGLTAAWSINNFILAPTVDAFLLQQKVFVNGGFKMTYLPLEGDRSNVFAAFGIGNAPEMSLLDGNLPVRFNILNTNVSVGGFYLVNGHFGLSGSIEWYGMGSNDDMMRNYIYLHLGTLILF
jgi:tetratricopeptide (TPR) repeat protein